MNLLTWLTFGLFVGILANAIDPRPSQGGIVGAIVLGILGATIGGMLANIIFGIGITGFNFTSFAVAVLGSLFLLMLGRALRST